MGCQYSDVLCTIGKVGMFLILLGYGLPFTAVMAGEISDLSLRSKQGVYELKLKIILDAPAEHVHHVVTDYAHIYRLNPSIVESEILNTVDSSAVRVKTLINDCLWIFCREFLRVEDVRELGTGNIYAVVVPDLSNIKSGLTIWQIQPLGGRTRVHYHMIIEPGFVIPPLIGTHLVKQKLREEVLTTLDSVERIARIRYEMEARPDLTLPDSLTRPMPEESDGAN